MKKIISVLLVLTLCLSSAVTTYASDSGNAEIKVTLDVNDETTPTTDVTIIGDAYHDLPTPAREGLYFAGFSREPPCHSENARRYRARSFGLECLQTSPECSRAYID